MRLLLLVSLLWGFSFGLIKAEFPDLSGSTLAAARLLLALPCFLPFLRLAPLSRRQITTLLAIGAVQYGFMYLCLFNAFRFLQGYEVAVLTVFTPLYVVLAHGLFQHRWPPARFWLAAIAAVLGALWIFQPTGLAPRLTGILLMQLSNACFAAGQIAYRSLKSELPQFPDHTLYAIPFFGAAATALLAAFLGPAQPLAELAAMDARQWTALLYLGTVASGLGFFLWNAGAARTSPATLAVFNNLKIPVAIFIALLVFGEPANLAHLIPGTAVLLAAFLYAEFSGRRQPAS